MKNNFYKRWHEYCESEPSSDKPNYKPGWGKIKMTNERKAERDSNHISESQTENNTQHWM